MVYTSLFLLQNANRKKQPYFEPVLSAEDSIMRERLQEIVRAKGENISHKNDSAIFEFIFHSVFFFSERPRGHFGIRPIGKLTYIYRANISAPQIKSSSNPQGVHLRAVILRLRRRTLFGFISDLLTRDYPPNPPNRDSEEI